MRLAHPLPTPLPNHQPLLHAGKHPTYFVSENHSTLLPRMHKLGEVSTSHTGPSPSHHRRVQGERTLSLAP